MKQLILGVALSLASVYASAMGMGEAIDRAGQQRMLSQRIAQSFILTGIQPQSRRHQERLTRAMNKFQENLDKLTVFDQEHVKRGSLNKVATLWAEYKVLANAAVTKASAKEILDKSNVLLPAAHAYVLELQKLSAKKGAELVNVSGRQRMLSQRMAKNYLAQYWEIADEDSSKQFYEDIAEYQTMLEYLKASDANTPEITKNLLKTEGHFKYASKGFDGDMSLKGDRLIFVITGTTDTMLRNMDVITKQYAVALDKQSVAAR